MRKLCMLLMTIIACLMVSTASAEEAKPQVPPMKFTDKGLHVDLGRGGGYTFEYPTLAGSNQKIIHKIIEKHGEGKKAVVKYEGGGEIDLTVDDDGLVTMAFKNVPGDVATYSWHALLNYSHASGGGTWQVAGGKATPFPVKQAKPPHLFQGQTKSFTFTSTDGPSFHMALPDAAYVQLTDNREWGWKIFSLRFNAPYNRDWKTRTFRITSGPAGEAAAKRAPMVDQFGQDAKMDFPQKVKSLDELKADVAWEKEYYAKLQPPALDKFGGLPGSAESLGLKRTGFFHVEKPKDRWYLVDPEGNAFFYKGLCAFQIMDWTYTQGREDIYAWLPPRTGEFADTWKPGAPQDVSFHLANMTRKYGKTPTPQQWLTLMVDRVRKLGFNGAGAFSGNTQTFRELNYPFVGALPTKQWNHLKYLPGLRETFDPFDANQRATYLKSCAGLAKNAAEPNLIGYYMCNEPTYEDLPKVIPSLNGKWACKRELVKTLERKYGTIEAYNQAWNDKAASFDELNDRGLAVTTKQANADVHEFTGVFLDTLFKLLADGVHANDPNHMIIGARLQPGTANNEQLCRILSKYVDVFSLNYYTYYPDPVFVGRIHEWTGGKPMIWSEFHWSAPAESGLPGGVRDVASQKERGLAYRNYVERAATLGYVVGIEWFTIVDEPRSGLWFGKYGGDNTNTGLFSVVDRPWVAMTDQMAETNNRIYDLMAGKVEPFVYDNPKFSQSMAGAQKLKIARAAGPMTVDGRSDGWPGLPPENISSSRLVDGAGGEGFEANFRLCWDDKNLYVLATVSDPTPMKNTQSGNRLWSGDAVELFVGYEQPEKDGPLLFTDRHIILGAGDSNGKAYVEQLGSDMKIPVAVVQKVDGKGYTLEAAIPFEALGFTPASGQRVRFDLGIDDSSNGSKRDRQLMWNGTNHNSRDRGGWGTAEFLK